MPFARGCGNNCMMSRCNGMDVLNCDPDNGDGASGDVAAAMSWLSGGNRRRQQNHKGQ
jgi:hypothetical protein